MLSICDTRSALYGAGLAVSLLVTGCSPNLAAPSALPVATAPPQPQMAQVALTPTPRPTSKPRVEEIGQASWYGPRFHGKRTADGNTFNQHQLTAAHPTLPLGTTAEVTNLDNGKSVEVTVNDRGPYVKGRSIDLSRAAAKKIGLDDEGLAPVKIEATLPSSVAHSRRGAVIQVSRRTITIRDMATRGRHTYTVAPKAAITCEDRKCKLSEVRAGDVITVTTKKKSRQIIAIKVEEKKGKGISKNRK